MNKENKILLGILAFIVVCTIGYALFSETITINGTATAKGDWELTTTCQSGVPTALVYEGMVAENSDSFANASCTASENTVTFNVDLKYPTAVKYFTVKVKNTGSIPATFALPAGITDSTTVCTYNSSDNSQVSCLPSAQTDDYASIVAFGIEDSDGTIYNANSDMSEFIIDDTGDGTIKLEANQSVYFQIQASWPDGVGDKTGNTYIKTTADYELLFNQLQAE